MTKVYKKYYYLLIPVLITVLLYLRKIELLEIDDCFMMEMANSFRTNSHSEQLMFINVSLGYAMKFLYGIFPAVNWCSVLYLAVVNLAFIPLYKITQNYENKWLFAGILVVFQTIVLSLITFTVMPFICSVSAVLWCLEYCKKLDKHSIKHFLLVFLLFFMGFGMRGGDTYKCVLLMFIPLYYFSVREKRNSVWVIVTLLCVCTTVFYGMTGMQKAYKKSIPDEMYFNQFQKYRSMLTDSSDLEYEERRQEFEAIGMSENDINLFDSWKYADRNVFSEEILGKIANTRTFADKYATKFSDLPITPVRMALVAAYLFAALLCFMVFKNRRKEILFFTLFVLAATAYLFLRKRAPFRVLYPITLSSVIALMYIAMQEFSRGVKLAKPAKIIAYILIIVSFLGINGYGLIKLNRHAKSAAEGELITEYVISHNDKKYVTTEGVRRLVAPWVISLKSEDGIARQPFNIFGDWYLYSYFWYDQLEQIGISEYRDSAYLALLDKDVRMVYEGKRLLDCICEFLRENYGINAHYEIEEEIEGTPYKVHKFIREE